MIRAALRSLLARKLRLVMSGLAVVLGVAFVAGSLMFSDSLARSFTALFASTVGDVVVAPDDPLAEAGGAGQDDGADGADEADGEDDGPGPRASGTGTGTPTLPAGLVDRLADLPGAARADGRVEQGGVYVIGSDGRVVGGLGAPALGTGWTDAPAGNGLPSIGIVEGRAPERAGEVVLDDRTAEQGGYEIGDRATVLLSSRADPLEPTVVGIAGFDDGGSLNGATLAAFDTATAQLLFLDGERAYTEIWVTARDGTSQDELAAQAEEVLPDDATARTGDDEADDAATGLLDGLDFLTTLLLVFAGIALVVGAFVIVNTFSVLLAQRTRELALLRALGASRRQVVGSVLVEAFVLGVVGSTLGLALGAGLAAGIRWVVGLVGLDLSGDLVLAPRTVLAAYAVGVVVTVTAAWLPARRTGRIAPVQALRDDVALPEASVRRRFVLGLVAVLLGTVAVGIGLEAGWGEPGWWVGLGALAVLLGVTAAGPVIGRPFLAGVGAVYRRAFGLVGRLAGQNALRNPRRTTATASALMIGLTLVTTMAVIGESAKASVDRAVESNFVGDFVVGNVLGSPFAASYARRIAEVDGVETVAPLRFGLGEVDGGRQGLVATAPSALDLLGVEAVRGSTDALADGTVLLDDGWALGRDIGVGDDLELTTPDGARTVEVVGTFADNAIVPFPVLTTTRTLTSAGYPAEDNALIVDAADASDATEDAIAAVVADNPVIAVQDERQFAADRRAPIDGLLRVLVALLGLALVISVLGVVNTLALSVLERTREIGLLRAVGTSRRQVRTMIVLESVVISLLGAVLGLALGLAFGAAIIRAVRDQGLEVLAVPWGQLGWFLLAAVVVGVLAAALPARRAARLDVLGAISQE